MVDELEPPVAPVKRRRIVKPVAPKRASLVVEVPEDLGRGFTYDEKLLNEWLGEWAWHLSQDRGSKGFHSKVPGLRPGAGSHVATDDYADAIYEGNDAERSAVITVIVYEELPMGARMAVESAYGICTFTMRDYEGKLRQGKELIAAALKRRGYPL